MLWEASIVAHPFFLRWGRLSDTCRKWGRKGSQI